MWITDYGYTIKWRINYNFYQSQLQGSYFNDESVPETMDFFSFVEKILRTQLFLHKLQRMSHCLLNSYGSATFILNFFT